ncbi:MAG TPA: hypothetical protein ENJ50_06740 [Planctomycetaceae bacterium]|nr:hypothetical protein [Planctomycetaceae bacterium]
MAQLELFDDQESTDKRDWAALWEDFHAKNPEVYEMFEAFAMQGVRALKRQGCARIRLGAKAVWERLRWESTVGARNPYRLNNNFTAFYAREFMARHPELGPVFETRGEK